MGLMNDAADKRRTGEGRRCRKGMKGRALARRARVPITRLAPLGRVDGEAPIRMGALVRSQSGAGGAAAVLAVGGASPRWLQKGKKLGTLG